MTHRWWFKGARWLAWWRRTGEVMTGSNEGVANQIGAQLGSGGLRWLVGAHNSHYWGRVGCR
ncbi:unnamed protein product [Sphenostylis stenocarpa]|uniref:Uncharacterized protein n=1 Tax=Sphenostylis stenocarpa TaxID=92480 RepID=A0AA86S8E4_9FABA|nr:unnamed protein product [Sphenostylis stenocarpa]